MNLNFTQTITFECADPATLIELMTEWDRTQSEGDVTGYVGSRLLADREHLGRFVVVAEFGIVEPGVTAAEEALKHNRRPETQAFAAKMRAVVDAEPEWHHFDEIYRTDF